MSIRNTKKELLLFIMANRHERASCLEIIENQQEEIEKLKEENEQLKKDYVKCINCEELVKDDQICPRMYEAQKENWCMDCSKI
tara:strand:- start:1758 stop:2009 length:252 start_codon:yes stop_codon:yes gene_type:complete